MRGGAFGDLFTPSDYRDAYVALIGARWLPGVSLAASWSTLCGSVRA